MSSREHIFQYHLADIVIHLADIVVFQVPNPYPHPQGCSFRFILPRASPSKSPDAIT